jgi:hypothetical protein
MNNEKKIIFAEDAQFAELHERNQIGLPQARLEVSQLDPQEEKLILTYDNQLWRDLMYAQLYRQLDALLFSTEDNEYVILKLQRPGEELMVEEENDLVAFCQEVHEYFGEVEFKIKLNHLQLRKVYDQTTKQRVEDVLITKESIYPVLGYKNKLKHNQEGLLIHFKAYRSGRTLEAMTDVRCQYDNKQEFNEYLSCLLAEQPKPLATLTIKPDQTE